MKVIPCSGSMPGYKGCFLYLLSLGELRKANMLWLRQGLVAAVFPGLEHGSLRDVTASALQAVSRVDSIKKVVNRLEPCGTRREGNECHREGSEASAAFGGEQQGRLDGFACRA